MDHDVADGELYDSEDAEYVETMKEDVACEGFKVAINPSKDATDLSNIKPYDSDGNSHNEELHKDSQGDEINIVPSDFKSSGAVRNVAGVLSGLHISDTYKAHSAPPMNSDIDNKEGDCMKNSPGIARRVTKSTPPDISSTCDIDNKHYLLATHTERVPMPSSHCEQLDTLISRHATALHEPSVTLPSSTFNTPMQKLSLNDIQAKAKCPESKSALHSSKDLSVSKPEVILLPIMHKDEIKHTPSTECDIEQAVRSRHLDQHDALITGLDLGDSHSPGFHGGKLPSVLDGMSSGEVTSDSDSDVDVHASSAKVAVSSVPSWSTSEVAQCISKTTSIRNILSSSSSSEGGVDTGSSEVAKAQREALQTALSHVQQAISRRATTRNTKRKNIADDTAWIPRDTYAQTESPREQLERHRQQVSVTSIPSRKRGEFQASGSSDDSDPDEKYEAASGHWREACNESHVLQHLGHKKITSEYGNGVQDEESIRRSDSLNNLKHSESAESSGDEAVLSRETDYDTDGETDKLLNKDYQLQQHPTMPDVTEAAKRFTQEKQQSKTKKVELSDPTNPEVLIEGVLFRCSYLGSTQLISDVKPTRNVRMMQAQEAVGRIKAPDDESQPSTAVDLFVSTEKLMVLNTGIQEIMMDHSLRSISFIADIGDLLVVMARRRSPMCSPDEPNLRPHPKVLCHVFETEEAQIIAQSIGEAFQVAYYEFLKASGIEDTSSLEPLADLNYQEVLNQQQLAGDELALFADRGQQREVIVPKAKGEALGLVIVESGWGSLLPTVVIANMDPNGPATRCGKLNIGDQLLSVSGISLVGLPLSTCQRNIRSVRSQTSVRISLVRCAPVVEVMIRRPDLKYQLGFSVQNGVICSLLRGGIAERGGIRVGHRIIEINGQSVVAVSHEKIVSLLAKSLGEIKIKTMPTAIFRLLTGQENPHYL